jgi:hypothetical protein
MIRIRVFAVAQCIDCAREGARTEKSNNIRMPPSRFLRLSGELLLLAATAVTRLPAQTSGRDSSYFARAEAQWRGAALPVIERQRSVSAADPEARQYVTNLGERLAKTIPVPPAYQYRFILYDDSLGLTVPWFGTLKQNHQVSTLPGGIILVPSSLFEVTADESEFAAPIARGIAHAALKHFERTRAVQAGVIPIPPGETPLEQRQPFRKSLIFTRQLEGEADRGAVGILAGADINPDALVRFARNPQASIDTSGSRVQVIAEAISKLAPRTFGPGNSPQFRKLKGRLRPAETLL